MSFQAHGVFDPAELLVAESMQARAWAGLGQRGVLDPAREKAQRTRLAEIVLGLMLKRSSCDDLASAAIDQFLATTSMRVPAPSNVGAHRTGA